MSMEVTLSPPTAGGSRSPIGVGHTLDLRGALRTSWRLRLDLHLEDKDIR